MLLCAPTLFLALQVPASAAPCDVRVLPAPNSSDDVRFGEAMAWNGETLAVSAPFHPRGRRIGVVYLFERSGDNWFRRATLAPDPVQEGFAPGFGSELSWDGDVLLVGTPSGSAAMEGQVYRFEEDGQGVWVASCPVVSPEATGLGGFGNRVRVHDDQLFVSDTLNPQVGSRGGAVFVFDRVGGDWVLRQKLVASDGRGGGQLGSDLALEDDQLIVGAVGAQQAYAFERQPDGSWLERQVLASPTSTVSGFGVSVALGSDSLFVGAYRTGVTQSGEGVVEVFENDGSAWRARQTLADPVALGALGFHIWYAEGRLFAGALAGPLDAQGPGRLLVYEQQGGAWGPVANLSRTLLDVRDQFGYSAVVDGDLLLVGAPGNFPFAGSPGFVQGFSLSGLACADFAGDVPALSASTGGVQTLRLDAGPRNAGDRFFVVGSWSGVYEGTRVDSVRLPIDRDAYTSLFLGGGLPDGLFSATTGVLDGGGRASLTLTIGPPGLALAAHGPSHAYVLLDRATGAFDYASVPVGLLLDPSL